MILLLMQRVMSYLFMCSMVPLLHPSPLLLINLHNHPVAEVDLDYLITMVPLLLKDVVSDSLTANFVGITAITPPPFLT